MSSSADDLRDLFVEITGEEATVTERQEEPSRDPVDAEGTAVSEEVAAVLRDDGLDDAVAGTEAGSESGE